MELDAVRALLAAGARPDLPNVPGDPVRIPGGFTHPAVRELLATAG
jgi:hypothetical protein